MTGYMQFSPLQWALENKYGYELADSIMSTTNRGWADRMVAALPQGWENKTKDYYDKKREEKYRL